MSATEHRIEEGRSWLITQSRHCRRELITANTQVHLKVQKHKNVTSVKICKNVKNAKM